MNKILYVSIGILFFMCFSIYAQDNDTLFIQRNERGKIDFARFLVNENSDRKMDNDTTFLKSILQAKEGDEFRLKIETIDELGITSKRFQQYYRGVKVENAEYLLHGRNGHIEVMNGDYQDVRVSNAEPAINEQQALLEALKYVGAEKYRWESSDMEVFIKQNTNNPNATYYPEGELVITKDYMKDSFRLSWKFPIASLQPYNLQMIFVDAISGEIIQDRMLIMNANVPGAAQTLYSGAQDIICDGPYSGAYKLYESRNTTPGNFVTIRTAAIGGSDITNTSTNWAPIGWINFNQFQHALDVHWGIEKVVDYFSNVHSRNGYSNMGLSVVNYVHHNQGLSDAMWNPWPDNFIIFGDGDGIITNKYTSLDIVAHEFGHGVTCYSSDLYYNKNNPTESAALNEGFSDIWGICINNYVNLKYGLNKSLWLHGSEVFLPNTWGYNCLRNIANPKSNLVKNYPTNKYPDTYGGVNWNASNWPPHFNSTILSHWFYIVSVGKSGTNDKGNSYSVSGVGISKAEKIAYRTLLNLNSTANYVAARNISIQAALDLYGWCSPELIAVTNAWYAVGVGSAFTYPNNVTVSGTKTGTNNITGSSITIQNAIFKSNSNTKVNACGSILINPRTVIESGSKVVITK